MHTELKKEEDHLDQYAYIRPQPMEDHPEFQRVLTTQTLPGRATLYKEVTITEGEEKPPIGKERTRSRHWYISGVSSNKIV